MQMDEINVGDQVLFGRKRGEKTKGTIVKKNKTRVKVRQDEARGTQKSHHVGTVWTVPPALIYPDHTNGKTGKTATEPPKPKTPKPEPLKFNQFDEDNLIIEAIVDVYQRLSPEWLSADGERPVSEVRRLSRDLHRKLNHLQKALGREVSESEAYNWLNEKMASERDQARRSRHPA